MNRGVFSAGNSWKPPLFTLGKFPIHVTGLIVLLQVVGMLVLVVAGSSLLPWVGFDAQAFLSGRIWTAVTYAFFEPASFWFVVGIYFFYLFGSRVEEAMDRNEFVTLCLILLLIPPSVFLLFHVANLPVPISSLGLPLGNVPHMAVFMAFCAMHPNVPSFFGIPIKWFGLAFFVMGTLQWVTYRIWPMALAYLFAVGFAIWFVRRLGHREGFALEKELLGPGRKFSRPRLGKGKKKKTRRAREVKSKLVPKSPLLKVDDTEVDRILDKINTEGLHSLTDEERELLQRKAGK